MVISVCSGRGGSSPVPDRSFESSYSGLGFRTFAETLWCYGLVIFNVSKYRFCVLFFVEAYFTVLVD